MSKAAQKYDAIIIGGGHNGLVAGAYLANARWRVLVLERREVLGGAAGSQEIFPGFKVNTGAVDGGLLLPQVASELRLKQRGLQLIQNPAIVHALQPDGNGLTLWRDAKRAAAEIARFSAADAARYTDYLRWVARMTAVLSPFLLKAPPPIPELKAGDMAAWLPAVLKIRRLGKKDMTELMRALPMPVSDFLDEWFESPIIKAALGTAGVKGSLMGPRASGTVFMLLYQAVNAGQAAFRASSLVKGGMGALSDILADTVRARGGEIRCGVKVEKILLEGGRARGVALAEGEEIPASVILSSANPRHTFLELVGAPNLPVSTVREVRNIRFRGSLARLNLALSELPQFASLEDHTALTGHTLVCPSLEYLEQAYDDAKYGQISHRPMLDIMIPSLLDDGLAPAGQHLMQVDIQYAPYHLQGETWEGQRDTLAERTIGLLEEHAPGIRQLILHQQLLTPLDLEREYGLAEGCIYHGQMALDQLLFMRPVPGYELYTAPVESLFLCGAGSHPGGGVSGAPGRNAARLVLKRINPT